ncbi:MAG: SUMF1/EgtB/PvdO family nonheme iron enzyme [Candidatus Eisenbacteria bacterium]
MPNDRDLWWRVAGTGFLRFAAILCAVVLLSDLSRDPAEAVPETRRPAPVLAAGSQPRVWVGSFGLGERHIPFILRIAGGTAGVGGSGGSGERSVSRSTVDRIDRIAPPEFATSAHVTEDSLRVIFPGIRGGEWEFILARDEEGLSGILEMREGDGYEFQAAFVPMVALEAADLDLLAGAYEAEDGARLRISSDEDGTLIAHVGDGDRFQMLFPSSVRTFFAGPGPTRATPVAVTVRFAEDTVEWTEGAKTVSYARVRSSEPPVAFREGSLTRGPLTMPCERIQPGSFDMGDRMSSREVATMLGLTLPEGQEMPDPEPVRPTTLTRPFLMSRFEVTNAWFSAFVEETGYMTDCERAGYGQVWNGQGFDRTPGVTWRHTGFEGLPDAPAVFVSWNDASAFTAWLSQQSGRSVRIPTEAEWEYACGAGTSTMFSCGNDSLRLDEHAWSMRNAHGPQPVGTRLPNPWGLCDMHGNVWEWCADGYAPFTADPVTDPIGPDNPGAKILRGGSWINGPWSLRTAFRGHDPATLAEPHVGFRVVVDVQGD